MAEMGQSRLPRLQIPDPKAQAPNKGCPLLLDLEDWGFAWDLGFLAQWDLELLE
jgi:hypothetical protein